MYKRQALTVTAFTVLFAGGVPAFGALFVFLGALSVARPVPVAVAVSYTHLDVYKRQLKK